MNPLDIATYWARVWKEYCNALTLAMVAAAEGYSQPPQTWRRK